MVGLLSDPNGSRSVSSIIARAITSAIARKNASCVTHGRNLVQSVYSMTTFSRGFDLLTIVRQRMLLQQGDHSQDQDRLAENQNRSEGGRYMRQQNCRDRRRGGDEIEAQDRRA